MTRGAVHFGVDIQFFANLRANDLSLPLLGLPSQVRYFFNRPQTSVRVAMTVQTELHRQRLDLSNDFHLVDSTVTLHTAHATRDMGTVIEVHEIWQVMNTEPIDRSIILETLSNWLQLFAGVVHHGKRPSLDDPISTVTVATSRRRWNGCVGSSINGVMAIAAVEL